MLLRVREFLKLYKVSAIIVFVWLCIAQWSMFIVNFLDPAVLFGTPILHVNGLIEKKNEDAKG